ncbi:MULTISPECIES: proline dehydrogenase family protein [Brevibacillus]|uniref:Proline dehydrogenase n=1 Tax=Brevibacillus invocatus TaxID=173959 RepID=A0A3M8C678_9BACL|nr:MULTISPECIES: proline dehydrogenase family protein [Brevibacillus]MCM3078683.1 proline dehydrogenase family protein [Brevibacillus invocatus]MCM3429068.1 proline dehydrogenase family protein [Brevibacillus invocatus]MDH4616253.1 proline dehydrogenase family protein [Brevibacillus sp. AY1]RNB71169.1 proline dehydrogenase [Brevibacillus invocatus]
MRGEEIKTAEVLRTIARNPAIQEMVMQSPQLYTLLLAAAKRYVTGETSAELLERAVVLADQGYLLSAEYIGENTKTIQECSQAKEHFIQLARDCGRIRRPVGISFDLSHIGLLLDPQLAYTHAEEMAEEARKQDHYLMVSMEESTKTEAIVQLYEQLAERHENIGITIQAHLHRSFDDLTKVLQKPGKIRLVKGAFREHEAVALGRGEELNERYLLLAERCALSGHDISFATHDQLLIDELERRGYLHLRHAELEMLYGVRPEQARLMRDKGVTVRLYLTYGTEWYLYLCHRLAEYPPHIHQAIADMAEPSRTQNPGYE